MWLVCTASSHDDLIVGAVYQAICNAFRCAAGTKKGKWLIAVKDEKGQTHYGYASQFRPYQTMSEHERVMAAAAAFDEIMQEEKVYADALKPVAGTTPAGIAGDDE